MQITIFINSRKEKPEVWRQVFHKNLSEYSVIVQSINETTDYSKADFIIQGMDAPLVNPEKCTQLKAIASPGAGVDHILFDDECKLVWPAHIPVIRVRDEILGILCSDYVLMRALYFNIHMHNYRYYQKEKRWHPHLPGNIKRIGILGMGDIGIACATRLKNNHFEVCGWRKHKDKDNHNIPTYTGKDGLLALIRSCNFLVNALPLTDETYKLINSFNMQKLPLGSCIVNIGRGKTLVSKDLLFNLSSGHLAHAYLDVFDTEPLPADDPFWSHLQVHLTPHIAGIYTPNRSAIDLSASFRQILNNQPVNNQIDYNLKY